MSIFLPATADLVDRLTRYRDRLIASGRSRSATIVDAAISDLQAEAAADDQHRGETIAASR